MPGPARRRSAVCWLPLASSLDRAHNDLDRDPDDNEIDDHLPGDHNPRRLGLGRDIAEPDRREHGDGEYSASVRVSGWLKLPAVMASITT